MAEREFDPLRLTEEERREVVSYCLGVPVKPWPADFNLQHEIVERLRQRFPALASKVEHFDQSQMRALREEAAANERSRWEGCAILASQRVYPAGG